MEQIISELMKMFPMLNAYLAAGIFIFSRLLGFFRLAPVFNRREIAGLVKLALVFILTLIITPLLKPGPPPGDVSPLLLLNGYFR